MTRELAARARELRQVDGMSMKRIASSLGVSLSSVSRWTRDIELTPAQEARLRAANPRFNGQMHGQLGRSRTARAVRVGGQSDGRRRARQHDLRRATGCMLYWAEGSKLRNSAILTNSDPDLLATFVWFLRTSYAVPDSKLALSVNCHLGNGLELDEIEQWWLDRLALPRSCLRRATVNRPSSASSAKRGHVLPYGTARVCAYSVQVIQSIYGAIQEYAGIDRPEWLDSVSRRATRPASGRARRSSGARPRRLRGHCGRSR